MTPSIYSATISIPDKKKLILESTKSIPEECCGVIGLKKVSGKLFIKPVILVNESKSIKSFKISKRSKEKGILQLEELGYSYCGSFHSHVNYPAIPSPIDFKLAQVLNELWLIYSLSSMKLCLYQKKKFTFNKINLETRKLSTTMYKK